MFDAISSDLKQPNTDSIYKAGQSNKSGFKKFDLDQQAKVQTLAKQAAEPEIVEPEDLVQHETYDMFASDTATHSPEDVATQLFDALV